MSSLNQTGVVFHDKPNGGWYCTDCKQYIHPDMIYSHPYTHQKFGGFGETLPNNHGSGNNKQPMSSLREEITGIAYRIKTGFPGDPDRLTETEAVDAILAAVEGKAIKLSELRIPRMGIGHPENDDYLRGYNAAIDAIKEAIHE